MPTFSGPVLSASLPNFEGALFRISPDEATFLSAIGGLNGAGRVESTIFGWQFDDLRAPAADRQRVEGAAPPTAESRSRFGVQNVVEIHQEQLDISYSAQGNRSQVRAIGNSLYGNATFVNGAAVGIAAAAADLGYQASAALLQIARDINASFINGTYQAPANNTTARRTRGLIEAITTGLTPPGGSQLRNRIDRSVAAGQTARVLTADDLGELAQSIFDNGGSLNPTTTVIMCGSRQRRRITQAVKADGIRRDVEMVGIAGRRVDGVITDFGTFPIVVERLMAADQVALVDLAQCQPVFMEIPGKGTLFTEPLAKTKAADQYQMYGEVGLNYGNPLRHGILVGLEVVNP